GTRRSGNRFEPRTYADSGFWEADHVFLQRANDGKEYLPGSSLRGVLRSQAERIDAATGAELSQVLFGWAKSEDQTGMRGLMEIGDGTFEGKPTRVFLDHVAIDRITGAA